MDDAGPLQYAQMLGDGLARDPRACGELRRWTPAARKRAGPRARAASRRRARRRARPADDLARARLMAFARHRCRCSSSAAVQPPSFMRKASARRWAGMFSNPDSVSVSRVPVEVFSRRNSTSVGGSLEYSMLGSTAYGCQVKEKSRSGSIFWITASQTRARSPDR